MRNEKVIEAIKSLKIGRSIVLKVNNDGATDYFTKTRWFDSVVYILGGSCMFPMIFDAEICSCEDIYDKIQNIYKCSEIELKNEYVANIDITCNSLDSFRTCKVNNFKTVRKNIL